MNYDFLDIENVFAYDSDSSEIFNDIYIPDMRFPSQEEMFESFKTEQSQQPENTHQPFQSLDQFAPESEENFEFMPGTFFNRHKPLQTDGFKYNPAEKPNNKQYSKVKKIGQTIFNFLFCILVISIIGGAVLFGFSNDARKSYFGYRLYTVKTASMTPREDGSSPAGGFRAGDAIIVKLCEPESVQVGDIVTYVSGSSPDVYLTHRVVNVLDHLNDNQGIFFITRGDANNADDPPITGKAIVGKKVLTIPDAGFIFQFIRDNFILSIIIIVSGFGLVILWRAYFSNSEKTEKRKQYVNLYTVES